MIVTKSLIEDAQLQFIVNQIAERIFECAFLDLLIEKYRYKLPLGVGVRLVFGHGFRLSAELSGGLPFGAVKYTSKLLFLHVLRPFPTDSTLISADPRCCGVRWNDWLSKIFNSVFLAIVLQILYCVYF